MGNWILFNKWVIASILYVAVVIGGFTFYEEFIADDTVAVSAAKHEGNENHNLSEEKIEDIDHDSVKNGGT